MLRKACVGARSFRRRGHRTGRRIAVGLLTLALVALSPVGATAHTSWYTGQPEAGVDNPGYEAPNTFYGKTFQNPKFRIRLQDNGPRTYAYGTGTTSTSGYVEWDMRLSPSGSCQNLTTSSNRIDMQFRDLDAAGNPLSQWRATNGFSHSTACTYSGRSETYHWGPDSIGFVTQGAFDFEMRLVDRTSGLVYMVARGKGGFVVPRAPSGLIITDITKSSIGLEWLNNSGSTNYFEVWRATNEGGPWTKIADHDQNTAMNALAAYTDTSVQAGVEYWYRVRGVNGIEVSEWSNIAASRAGIIDRETSYGSSLAVNPTAEHADPVNTLTGAFVTSTTDLSLPGVGIPFRLERNYNSADVDPGKLGVGWAHPYESNLVFLSGSKVRVESGDGQRVVFTKQPDGSYKAGAGTRVTLVALPGAYEVRHLDGSVERYDTYGKLYQVKDPNGNKLTMGHSSTGLTTITDSVGRTISLSYNAGGRLSGVTLPDGRGVTYSYTTTGLLETVTDARGGVTRYAYDTAKRLTKIIDQNNVTLVTNTYNAKGRVTQQVDARNHVWQFAWDSNTQTATMTDPRGHQSKDVYSGNVLRRRIDGAGNITALDYDDDLNVVAITDPRGRMTSMTYDSRGNMLTRTSPPPQSNVEHWTYDATNRVTSHTDARGATTSFVYDAKGNLDSVERPGGVVTDFTRDPVTGVMTAVTDPRSKTTSFVYDTRGNLIEVRRPGGAVVTYDYDASGRLTGMVDPRGNVAGAAPADYRTAFSYDASNHLTTVTDPLGRSTTTTFDPAGRAVSTTDPKNRTTTYGYNAAGLLTSVTAPDGTVTSYSYDAAGNMITRNDAKNHSTSYGYDAANRLTSVTSHTGQRWTYDYDAGSNVIRVTDAAGNATSASGDGVTSYTYDSLERVTDVTYSDATPDVSFGYDANGNVTSMVDGEGTTEYTYDPLDRLTGIARGADEFTYAYDHSGNVTSRSYPGGTTSTFAYDADGRLATVETGGRVTSYTYDQAGRLIDTALPVENGYSEVRTYDRAGTLTKVSNVRGDSILSETSYVNDEVGNPVTATTLTGTRTYSYDALDRLVGVCDQAACTGSGDPLTQFEYDAVGNRTKEITSAGTTTMEYDAADQILTATTGGVTKTFDHDANGNLTRAGSRTFTYDAAGRMASVSTGSDTTAYAYDGMGNRTTAATSPQDVVEFVWDANLPLPQLVLERDGAGAPMRRFEHGIDAVSMTSGGERSYYHYDALGSVTHVTDASGDPLWTYRYDAFGATRDAVKADPLAPENPLRFTGEYQDATGLYHLRARQYDPDLGRFTRRDPYMISAARPGVSSYAYVDNRPTGAVDPSGLCFLWLPHNDDGSCKGKEIAYGTRYILSSPATVVGFAIGESKGDCSFTGETLTITCVGEDPVPFGAPAQTWGSTVLAEAGEVTPKLMQHEQRHVDQWILGVPGFPLLYFGNEAVSRVTGNGSCWNWFEYSADFHDGGYDC